VKELEVCYRKATCDAGGDDGDDVVKDSATGLM